MHMLQSVRQGAPAISTVYQDIQQSFCLQNDMGLRWFSQSEPGILDDCITVLLKFAEITVSVREFYTFIFCFALTIFLECVTGMHKYLFVIVKWSIFFLAKLKNVEEIVKEIFTGTIKRASNSQPFYMPMISKQRKGLWKTSFPFTLNFRMLLLVHDTGEHLMASISDCRDNPMMMGTLGVEELELIFFECKSIWENKSFAISMFLLSEIRV